MDDEERKRKLQDGKAMYEKIKSLRNKKNSKKKKEKEENDSLQPAEGAANQSNQSTAGGEDVKDDSNSSDIQWGSVDESTDPKSCNSDDISIEELSCCETVPEAAEDGDPIIFDHQSLEISLKGKVDISELNYRFDNMTDFNMSSGMSHVNCDDCGQMEVLKMKQLLDMYSKKLGEFQGALNRRDEVITQLSDRLTISLQTQDESQAESALQAEALAVEISLLKQQLVQTREILSRQQGVPAQELLEAQNTALLLLQENARKDTLVRDLCGQLSAANVKLDALKSEVAVDLDACQQHLHSLEGHCLNENSSKSGSTLSCVSVEVQTKAPCDLFNMDSSNELPGIQSHKQNMPAILNFQELLSDCQENSDIYRTAKEFEQTVLLQQKLNCEVEKLQKRFIELTEDTSVSSNKFSEGIDRFSISKDSLLLESKISNLNSKLKDFLEIDSDLSYFKFSASDSEMRDPIFTASKLNQSITTTKLRNVESNGVFMQSNVGTNDVAVNVMARRDLLETKRNVLTEELGNLKNMYSSFLALQGDMQLMCGTFCLLQETGDMQEHQLAIYSKEIGEIKTFNAQLEGDLVSLTCERDQLKLLVGNIKQSLNDATSVIEELRLENVELLNSIELYKADISAAKNCILNCEFKFSDEMVDSFRFEKCVRCLIDSLQKSKLEFISVSETCEQMYAANKNLEQELTELKEKYEVERQEKELLCTDTVQGNTSNSLILTNNLASSPVSKIAPHLSPTEFYDTDTAKSAEVQLHEQFKCLLEEKMALEIQLCAHQTNCVSISVYEAAKQEIHRLERSELRLCSILAENDALQKKIEQLEHDLNELLQSNSLWKEETKEIEQGLMSKLIEVELMKGELESQIQEKDSHLSFLKMNKDELENQLCLATEKIVLLSNPLDSSSLWEDHRSCLLEISDLKHKFQVQLDETRTMEARLAYYKARSEQHEALHENLQEQFQPIREQLQTVWDEQDRLRREFVECTLEKEVFQKELFSTRKQLALLISDKEAAGIHVRHVPLLGGKDDLEKAKRPGSSEHSSSIKEDVFEQDSINSSFDFSDSLASEGGDTGITKDMLRAESSELEKLKAVAIGNAASVRESEQLTQLLMTLDLKDLHICDLQLQLQQAKLEHGHEENRSTLLHHEQLLEQRKVQAQWSWQQIQNIFLRMDSNCCRKVESALNEMMITWRKDQALEILKIHEKHRKEIENLMLQNSLISSCNNNGGETIPSLKQQALQILEVHKQAHLSCLEEQLKLENLSTLESLKSLMVQNHQKESQESLLDLQQENETLRQCMKSVEEQSFLYVGPENCTVLLEKFLNKLHLESLQHCQVLQSEWDKQFVEELNLKAASAYPTYSYDDNLFKDHADHLSKISSQLKDKEGWLQLASAMQQTIEEHAEHLSQLQTSIKNECQAMLNIKNDFDKCKVTNGCSSVQTEPIGNGDVLMNSTDNVLFSKPSISEHLSLSISENLQVGELELLKEELSTEREERALLIQKHSEYVQLLQENYVKTVEALRDESNKAMDKELSNLLKKHEEEIITIQATQSTDLRTLRSDLIRQKEEEAIFLVEKHSKELAELAGKHATEMALVNDITRLDDIKLMEDSEPSILRAEHELEMNNLREELEQDFREVKESIYMENLKKINEVLAGSTKELETESQKFINLLTEKDNLHSVERGVLKSENTELVKNLQVIESEKNYLLKFYAEKEVLFAEEIEKLKLDISKLEMKVQESESRKEELSQLISEKEVLFSEENVKLKSDISELEMKLQDIENEKQKLSILMSEKESLFSSERETVTSNELKFQNLETENHKFLTLITENEVKFTKDNEKQRSEIAKLGKKVDNLEIENQKLITCIAEKESLFAEESERLAVEYLKLESNVQELEEEKEKLSIIIKGNEDHFTNEKERLVSEYSRLEATLKDYEFEKQAALVEKENFTRQQIKIEQKLQEQIAALIKDHEDDLAMLKKVSEGQKDWESLYKDLQPIQVETLRELENIKTMLTKNDEAHQIEMQRLLEEKRLQLLSVSSELNSLREEYSAEIKFLKEKHEIDISEKLKFSSNETIQLLKNEFEQQTADVLIHHSSEISHWEERLNGVRNLLMTSLQKFLEAFISNLQVSEDTEEELMRQALSMVSSYVEEVDVLLGNEYLESVEDQELKIGQNLMLDVDIFIHEKLKIAPSDISSLGKLREMERQVEELKAQMSIHDQPKIDVNTSTEDLNVVDAEDNVLAEVELLRMEIQQNMTVQDQENHNMAREIQALNEHVSQVEMQNKSLQEELDKANAEVERKAAPSAGRDWLAGTELSSVDIDSWQVHAAQTNSRLLHVLSDLVKTFVDTEQNIQQSLARLGLSVFQTSDSGGLNEEDGPPSDFMNWKDLFSSKDDSKISGQLHHGSREDFSVLSQHSGEMAFEMCEDGLDLTPRAWDLFAAAFRNQEVESEGEDVVLGASRRLRSAVDQVLSLLGELMELQSLQDMSFLHQRNEELSDELREEERSKMEIQAQVLKLEVEIQSGEQERHKLEEKLAESEHQNSSLWTELEGARLRLGRLEVTHEGLAQEKKHLQEQSTLLASGLQGTEQSSNHCGEDISSSTGLSPELVAENCRLVGEKCSLQEKQETERQQLLRRVHRAEVTLEETIADREELQERLRREIQDLKEQMEAMDKQMHSNKKFIEEQGHEREQEREEYAKELHRLKEALREKDRGHHSEDRLLKEVESLEQQLRSKLESLLEANEKREESESGLRQLKDKTLDLQEVITELERQLEDRGRIESELREQMDSLRAEVSEHERHEEELSEQMSELQESQWRIEQKERIGALEEQLESRNQELQQLQHYHTLMQEFRGQLHVLDERVESKSRQLERFSCICSLSPVPSEDTTSASDYRDPEKAIMLIQEGGRVLSPASAHWEELRALENRIDSLLATTDEIIRRHKDLEVHLRSLRSCQDEVALEKSILQEQLNDHLLQISSLKNRLEEKRFGGVTKGKDSDPHESTQLREELRDSQAKCTDIARMLKECQSSLSATQRKLQEQTLFTARLEDRLHQAQTDAEQRLHQLTQLQEHSEYMKKQHEIKLQEKSKIIMIDRCIQTDATSCEEGSDDATDNQFSDDAYDRNWDAQQRDISTQVGTPFNQLDIIPESEESSLSPDESSSQDSKVNQRLRTENRNLRSQSRSLEQQVNTLLREVVCLNKFQGQLQKDFNTLQSMVSEKDEELTALSQEVEDQDLLKREISQLRHTLGEKEKQLTSQQQSLNLLRKEITTLQKQGKKWGSECSQLQEALQSKTVQLESWQKSSGEHKFRADQMKESLENLRMDHDSQTKSAESVKVSLEKELFRLQQEASAWTERNQRESEKRQQDFGRLEAERDGLKQALKSTEKKLTEGDAEAQRNRRDAELRAQGEQRAHQEHLIQKMNEEHADKLLQSETQARVLSAKLHAAREAQETERAQQKEALKALLESHRQELRALTLNKERDLAETGRQITALREDAQRLRQQLQTEQQHQSLLLLRTNSRESTPDSDVNATASSSCTSSVGGESDGFNLLPPQIQKLCARLLKEGREVLSLTERHQLRQHLTPSPEKGRSPDLLELDFIPSRGQGERVASRGVQCDTHQSAEPSVKREAFLVALLKVKEQLLGQSKHLEELSIANFVSCQEEVVRLFQTWISEEKQWLEKQMKDLVLDFSWVDLTENGAIPPTHSPHNRIFSLEWWDQRLSKLEEHQTVLVQKLLSVLVSSQQLQLQQQPQMDDDFQMSVLVEQLESCQWQIQKQKELLNYSQRHEESLRQDFQSTLEQEKLNINHLNVQVREWRKRCNQLEVALTNKQGEVAKLSQSLDQAGRDLEHCRTDLEMEKFHAQQNLHALESERRNFTQVHAALYTERHRRDAARQRDARHIQLLKSVLHAHGLSGQASPLSGASASPLPSPMEPPELFLLSSSQLPLQEASFAAARPLTSLSVECLRCSLRDQEENWLVARDSASSPLLFSQNSTHLAPSGWQDETWDAHQAVQQLLRSHQAPQMALELFRLRRHKDSLCMQKRYLLRLLSGYQATESASLAALGRLGACTPPPTLQESYSKGTHSHLQGKRRCASFRVVALVVLSAIRLKRMGEAMCELQARQERNPQPASWQGRQRWRKGGSGSSRAALVPSPLPSSSATGSKSKNGLSSPWQARSPIGGEIADTDSSFFFRGASASEPTSNRSIHNTRGSANSDDTNQRSINDRRFDDCVERLNFLHQKMGLNTT